MIRKLFKRVCSVVIVYGLLTFVAVHNSPAQLRACDPHNGDCTYNVESCWFAHYQYCSYACQDPYGFGCCRHESGHCVNNPYIWTDRHRASGGQCS